MATVHPSRMSLVEGSSSSRPHYTNGDRGYNRRREENGRDRSRDKDDYADRRRERDRSGSRGHDDSRKSRSPERGRDERPRRRSPEYGSYRRDEPPHISSRENGGQGYQDGFRAPNDMYASRRNGGGLRGPNFGGGEDYFASRRMERAKKQVNIWPPSPKEETRDGDGSGKKDKRNSKRRRRTPSSSEDTDSEEERERRRRKEKKRKEKERDKDDRRRRKHRDYDEESGDERDRGSRHRRSRRSDAGSDDEFRDKDERRKSRHSSRGLSPPKSVTEEEEWVEKPVNVSVAVPGGDVASASLRNEVSLAPSSGAATSSGSKTIRTMAADEGSGSDDDDEVGPQPAAPVMGKKVNEREYGGALLRGEGSAMAAFLKEGDTDARIPRRGEIGLTSEEIANYEAVGYVMSGSRHRRMNAVRMRKENQVISAEEKRGILKLQKEEKERREAILREEFKELVEEKLKGVQMPKPPPSGLD